MILRSIDMQDFGLYAGRTSLDLVPRRNGSPIVLVGGKNGAGKTTLLEAVRLALYGRRALGARVARSDYEAYLRGRIHRSALRQAASVSIEFDYAEAGIVHRYRVGREWSARSGDVAEALSLEKDGEPVSAVPREEWHQFLQELVPPGVSQLFFFDGEKIQEIADGEEDNEHLAEAVRGLLGIELVTRLRGDIGLLLARHQRADRGELTARFESVVQEAASLERRAEGLAENVAELASLKESQARSAEQVRRRFVSEGGDAAAGRARLEAEIDEVRRHTERATHDMRELANRLLPFAMAPRLVASFRKALAGSRAGGGRAAAADLQEALLRWRGACGAARTAEWGDRHWSDLASFVAGWAEADGADAPAIREVGDGAAALERLAEVQRTTRPRALELRAELEALAERGRWLDAELARADNADSGPLLEEMRLAEQKVGATEARLHARQEDLRAVRGQLVTVGRERARIEAEQADAAKGSETVALAARTAQALAAYEARLLEHKLVQLEREFVERFNQLARKGDLISGVRVDRASFAATLVGRDGREVPKSELSAGEKQIYAIAMLWALARTSGRPLPMIIDTPLARLDSEHRDNLVRRYFPSASHQVVLLSTDTEVDGRLTAALGSNVSHAYRLDYDPAEARTVATEGYFGGLQARELPRALQQA